MKIEIGTKWGECLFTDDLDDKLVLTYSTFTLPEDCRITNP